MKIALLLLGILTISLSFSINPLLKKSEKDFARRVSRFGDITFHRNIGDSEETILTKTGEINEDPEAYKAALDTILDVTQNPQRKKEFL